MIYEVKSIKDYADKLNSKIETLNADLVKAKQKYGVFKSYLNYNNFPKYNSSATLEELQEIINNKNNILKIDEENKKIYKENVDIIESFIKDLIATGLPKEVDTYKRNKKITQDPNWIKELRLQIPLFPKYSGDWYYIEKHFKDKQDQYKRQKREEEEKLAHDECTAKLKLIAIQIFSSKEIIDIDWSNIFNVKQILINKLCKLDPYLNLAHSMLSVRNNWGDGCDAVEDALFDELPKFIYNELLECCLNFEDGRIFRDCQYNYNVIFSLCDSKYYKLYNEIMELI